MLIKIDFGK